MPCANPGCGSADGQCPFIDLNDNRCAARFTLGRIGEAFRLCVNHHQDCHVYSQIAREQNPPAAPPQRSSYALLTPKKLNTAQIRTLRSVDPSLS